MDLTNDYELLYFIRQQNHNAFEYLFRKYEKMLWSIIHEHTKHYRYLGMERDDFMQHASLCFYQSVQHYREDKCASFSTFLYLCIERKVKTLLRDAFRGSNQLFLESISMDEEILNAENLLLVDTIENTYPEYCPQWTFQLKEEIGNLETSLAAMKEIERAVFFKWREGYTYKEIARALQVEVKFIDNTVQKARRLRSRALDYK